MRGTIRKGRPSFYVPMPALFVAPKPLAVLWFIQLEMDVWLLSVVPPSFYVPMPALFVAPEPLAVL